MKQEKFISHLGEPVTVHRSDTGNLFCPVCGIEWFETKDWIASLFPSCLEVCPQCETQIGLDDVYEVPAIPSNPAELRWHRLRIKWLNRIGWPESALEQLRTNLSIDTEALEREAGRAE